MENFSFIEVFISTFFNNEGLRNYFVYIIGAFGVAICIRVTTIAVPRLFKKWD